MDPRGVDVAGAELPNGVDGVAVDPNDATPNGVLEITDDPKAEFVALDIVDEPNSGGFGAGDPKAGFADD